MVDHFFNFETPIITVFARDTEGSEKQVFRVLACVSLDSYTRVCVYALVCGCVSVSCIACVHICMTCVVHTDLKVKAGLQLKIRMKRTRMPASHSRMRHAYAYPLHTHVTHTLYAREPCTQATHARHAPHACMSRRICMHAKSGLRAWRV